MEAASASNETLTLLLISMAVIVFIVGGIGIMNVLFVSIKGAYQRDRYSESTGLLPKGYPVGVFIGGKFYQSGRSGTGGWLLELRHSCSCSTVRESLSVQGAVLSLLFGVLTGSIFGFYPAYKASRLIPVEALNQGVVRKV